MTPCRDVGLVAVGIQCSLRSEVGVKRRKTTPVVSISIIYYAIMDVLGDRSALVEVAVMLNQIVGELAHFVRREARAVVRA